jgi:hypothetical protein
MTGPEDTRHDDKGSPPHQPEVVRHRRKSRWTSSCLRAKVSIVGIFLALRTLDAFVYFQIPGGDKSALLGAIINNTIWTTVLLAAIWFRKSWARYVLVIFLLVGVISTLVVVPDLLIKLNADNRMATVLGVSAIVYTVIIWHLLFSSDVDRLTGRSHG